MDAFENHIFLHMINDVHNVSVVSLPTCSSLPSSQTAPLNQRLHAQSWTPTGRPHDVMDHWIHMLHCITPFKAAHDTYIRPVQSPAAATLQM